MRDIVGCEASRVSAQLVISRGRCLLDMAHFFDLCIDFIIEQQRDKHAGRRHARDGTSLASVTKIALTARFAATGP